MRKIFSTNAGSLACVVSIHLVLAGCSIRIDGASIALQAEKALSKAYPGCHLTVLYKGVGEGDSNNAYVVVALISSRHAVRTEAELLLTRRREGDWRISQTASHRLVAAAKSMCTY